MGKSIRSLLSLLVLALFTIVTTDIASCNAKSDVVCMESEKQALLSFRRALTDPSNRLASWAGEEEDCCRWFGVVCHNLTGHVLELHLSNEYNALTTFRMEEYAAYEKFKLGGKINPSLTNLKHLRYLDLSGNDFGGIQIPGFLGSLGNLRYLNLFGAGFGGMIPHQLGNLSNLQYLSLGDSDLFDDSLQWLSSLSSLKHLHLRYMNLSMAFDWLQVTNILPSLEELHLQSCELNHFPSLPSFNFSSLTALDLSENYFDSLIPPWILGLSRLVSLQLRGCGFQGSIPEVTENMTSLRFLDVSYNYLNSSLPRSMVGLQSLVSLSLGINSFEGPIPSGLQNLSSLRVLDLSYNYLNSTIPNWLYAFPHLKFLNLESNFLQGRISDAIGNLTSAVSLDLSNNELEGGVPRSLGNICNLRVIKFSSMKIGQDASKVLDSLSKCILDGLDTLYLDDCKLSGQFIDVIDILRQSKKLAKLYLSKNSLYGPIPESIGSLPFLKKLDVGNNQLNGTLPESLGQLADLEELIISYNPLEGDVTPTHFANLTNLRIFGALGNQLTLKVSAEWVPPFQLKNLLLDSWYLGPQFPLWLRSQKNLMTLQMSHAGISDTIPIWFWNLSSQYYYFNFSHNQIQGELANFPTDFPLGPVIGLDSNQFSGPLPLVPGYISTLDLSNNSFSGSISHFLCDKSDEPKRLMVLNLGNNHLSGEIPDCWMNWPSLTVVRLENNMLTGNIPRSMGSLSLLQSLHLRNNSFFGELPLSLQNCTELMTVDLSENDFVGSIPTLMGERLSSLMFLSLRSNKFQGHIPTTLCALTSLRILDLAHNNFSGTIPRCFNNFAAMAINQNSSKSVYVYTSYKSNVENALVVMKGNMAEYNTILGLVTSIDLSDNNLSGEIPKEITSLIGLRSLNLSENLLTGRIPEKIGTMGLLESIDFSLNHLSGRIPLSMSNLTFLNHLNLSFNNLTGRIPSSTQLQSLDASCFVGNKLCGPPLINCSISGVIPKPKNGGGKESDGLKVNGLYVSMAIGFIAGFWGVWGPLLFKRSWRLVYFQFLESLGQKFYGVIGNYC